MRRKIGFTLLAIMVTASALLAACSKKEEGATPSSSPQSATGESSGDSTQGQEAPVFTIEVMENGWKNTGTDGKDPFIAYMNKKFNIDFKFSAVTSSDLETKLMTRFAADNAPDLIFVSDPIIVKKLHNQSVLLDDWTPYLDKVPSIAKNLSEESLKAATVDGKLIGLPKAPEPNYWNFMIREDWLANLGLSKPTTDAELLDVLRKFTFDDPDKNGQDDTWGISSGKGLGELLNLQGMYGPCCGFYVSDDGKTQYPVTDDSHRKALELIRTIVQEKLVDPDFYTQGWEQRKPKLHGGKIGVAYYPPEPLISEAEQANGGTGSTLGWWTEFLPTGGELGGKRPYTGLLDGMYAISANAAKDPAKLEKIFEVLDGVTYPNEAFYALRWGIGVDGQELLDAGNGLKALAWENDNYRKQFPGAFDYGTWIYTSRDQVVELQSGKEVGDAVKKAKEINQRLEGMESYKNYHDLLNLDLQTLTDLETIKSEFEIQYVLGKTDDYEGFRQKWLASGGQKLLDEATQQFKNMGLIQ